jgi:hypothetical protein
MVTVILLETGQEIEILDGKVTYKKQNADIGDVVAIQTSYTWSMKFAKTPNITKAFKGLGIVGDISNFPYKKQKVAVLDNGVPIIRSGLLKVTETLDGEYKAFIQDGIIDFYEEIKDATISGTVDLSGLTHTNDIDTIISSFTQSTYRYIIADYNGQPMPNLAGLTQLNPLAMIPSVSIQYLWDLIFDAFGWTYSGNFDFNTMWMTYPNAITLSDEDNIQVLNVSAQLVEYKTGYLPNPVDRVPAWWTINSYEFLYLGLLPALQNHTIIFSRAGNYRAKFSMQGFWKDDIIGFSGPFTYKLRVNGIEVGPTGSSDSTDELTWDFIAYENTIVQLMLVSQVTAASTITAQGGYMTLETLGVQNVNFNDALIKYKIKDFFKEVLTRKALTPFVDVETRNIHFMSLDQRLTADSVNMSSKFIRRKGEKYIYDSYNQSNYLRHKYDKDGDDYNDGNLTVANENLPVGKDLYKSNTYAPLEALSAFNGTNLPEYFVNNFKMFEVEVEEDPDTGDLIGTYKGLKNRFYIFESVTIVEDIVILGTLIQQFPIANINGNTFDDLVITNYSNVKKLLDNTRIHKMEMDFSAWEIATMDMTKRHFIEQEASYYLINSILAKVGKFAEVEYVKIQSPEDIIPITPLF